MSTPPISQVAFGDLAHELKTTRRVLERVPDEHWDWKPHEKSYSLGQLARHIVDMVGWGAPTVRMDDMDLTTIERPTPPANGAELLAAFDRNAAAFQAAIAELEAPALGANWRLLQGETVLIAMPRAAALRGMIVNHTVHHRAQLTVYLRLLDIPVPAVYGPSADEQMF